MPLRPQPSYQLYEVCFRHSRATSRGPIQTAPNMEENRAADAGNRWIGIVPDFNEPVIRKIARAHFFVSVIVRRILGINYDMTIVIRRSGVITPHVCFGYVVIRVIRPRRQIRIVTKNFADLETSRRRSSIAFFLSKSRLILPRQPCSPRDPVFSKQYRERSGDGRPIAAARPLKQSSI